MFRLPLPTTARRKQGERVLARARSPMRVVSGADNAKGICPTMAVATSFTSAERQRTTVGECVWAIFSIFPSHSPAEAVAMHQMRRQTNGAHYYGSMQESFIWLELDF